MTEQLTEHDAKAADTGANATKVFQDKVKSGAESDSARVSAVARDALSALHDVIRKHDVTYAEYDALKAWLIRVGTDGEWPLFLDVFLEHVLEESVNRDRQGSKGTIEGPFYVPGAPAGDGETTLPMRNDEAGEPMVFQGTVNSVDGTPLGGAVVELWHADAAGFYSQFAPGLPQWNLRGIVIAAADGSFKFRTVVPAPYQIPTDGACGALIKAAGWHAWRPAHLHLKVSAPGHQLVTTQLYFPGDPHNEDDIASAVKPELMLDPQKHALVTEVSYNFVLDND
jgi:catechol 1,2-dioxygenase